MLWVHRRLNSVERKKKKGKKRKEEKKRKPQPFHSFRETENSLTAMNVRQPQLPAGLQFDLLTLGQDLPAAPHASLLKYIYVLVKSIHMQTVRHIKAI